MISETAAFATESKASSDGYRTVVSKTCDKRGADGLLFSAFANIGGIGETSVEMIGKDATTGVYNYYEVLDGGQWVFYGNSFDFIGNGYTCKARRLLRLQQLEEGLVSVGQELRELPHLRRPRDEGAR